MDMLFELPPGAQIHTEPVEPLTRGERMRALHERRIAQGAHPLAGIVPLALHPDAPRDHYSPGPRCGGCRWRQTTWHHSRTFPKCHVQDGLFATHSETSDVRAWWPACTHYQPKSEVAHG